MERGVTPRDYNASQLASGALTPDHVTELVRFWQLHHDLEADGMAGPKTLASLQPLFVALRIEKHWIAQPGAVHIPAHPSWYGPQFATGQPRGIVAHYTATNPGTAVNMAKNRTQPLTAADRVASWHITIETDGSIVQMVPLDHAAWHAGSSTAIPIVGLGQANYNTVGIELVGHGTEFPPAQVEAAKRVWRALVQHYGIQRQYAMLEHAKIDPTRRSDPGPVWMGEHAPAVLEAAYA